MNRIWLWGGGSILLVGLIAAGWVLAGTGGTNLFIMDTGRVLFSAFDEANAFKICEDGNNPASTEQNCHLLFVHPTDGLKYKGKCSGGACDTVLQVETGKRFDFKYGLTTLATMLPGTNYPKPTATGWTGARVGTGEPAAAECNDAATEDGKFYIRSDGSAGGKLRYCSSTWETVSGGAGGGPSAPLRPYSTVPITAGLTFPCLIDGDELLCYLNPTDGTFTANATWRLGFQLPLTSWTCAWHLVVDVRTSATTGVIKINPAWAAWAVGAARPTVVSEGVDADSVTGATETTTTITFDTPANELVRAKWLLNVTTLPTVGQRVAVDLVVEDSGSTVAADVGMQPYLSCE